MLPRPRSPLVVPAPVLAVAIVCAALVGTAAVVPPSTAAAVPVAVVRAPPAAPRTEIRGLLNLGASLTERAAPDYAAAEIAYWQVLRMPGVEPAETREALQGLAHLHRKHGDLTKAAAIYERYLAKFPGDDQTPDILLELGRTLRDLGAYKMAIARFYNVINSTLKVPGDFAHYEVIAKTAQFEIAETYFAAGQFDEANKYYMKFKLLDVAPEDRARAQFKAADALRREGKLEAATTALRRFTDEWPSDPNTPEAMYLLAVTLRDLKRPQEAYAAALELLRIEKARKASAPQQWLHWQLLTGNQLANDFFETGDVVAARTIYAALFELTPDSHWRIPLKYELGVCAERLGMREEAQSAYQAVLDMAGTTPAATVAELVRMAQWRLSYLHWRRDVAREVNAVCGPATASVGSR